jgi:polysaccharide biosynthesis/export protein
MPGRRGIARAQGGEWGDTMTEGPARGASGATQAVRFLVPMLVLAMGLSACSLPRTAATPTEVLRGTESAESNVQVVPVTRDALVEIARWPAPPSATRHNWPGASAQPVARTIRAGDTIALQVWDSQRDSLLTTDEQRMVPIQNLVVSSAGRIFVPYVGEVRVSGLTADAARREIEMQMRNVVPDGQVQLAVTPGSGNTIDVVTGVARPGRIAVPETSSTILSVLAEAGGISPTLRNPLVRLNRAGQGYVIPARLLFSDPARDIVLRGGDRVLVEEDQRNFVALGASGRQQVVYFEREEITALDALSTIGGLNATRSNLQGVMVLREYPVRSVRDTGPFPRQERVIFTFDLTSADGLFAASNFQIAPGDVVLATESALPAFAQMIALFRTVRALQ